MCYNSIHSPLIIDSDRINKHIIPKLGNYRLIQLSRIEYQKFINELIKKGYAKRTIQTIHSIFCTAINKAVELELLSHNKYRGISIKVDNDKSDEKINYLSRNQVDIFLKAAQRSSFHYFIIASLLLRTGMRKGEMLALRWDDIDFENKTVAITKTRSDHGVNKTIDSILKKTKLHHISPHSLRHTHAIMLLESGADIKFVSELLGHTTINMTADVYIHITQKYEGENVKKLESYLSNN